MMLLRRRALISLMTIHLMKASPLLRIPLPEPMAVLPLVFLPSPSLITRWPRIESIPSDITVVANPGECTAVVYWSEPIASDNCTPSHQIIKESSVESGEVFSVGPTRVLYRAFDAMGNESAVQSFTVTVEDKESPVLVLPGNLTIHCGDELPAPWQTLQQLAAAGGSATDNCSLDESTFSLRSETASAENCPYVLTRTYEIADAHGNIATAQHRIIVEGEEPVLKSGQGTEDVTLTLNSTNNVTCNGGSDGSIVIEINSTNPPYSVSWSGPISGNESNLSGGSYTISNLEAGNYTITVTDQDNNPQTLNETVTEPDALIITSQPQNQTDCKENQVEFSVSVDNAVGTVNYQWQRKRPADADFGNVAGGNSATLTVTNIGVGGEDVHGSLYRVIVTDNCQAITSNEATLNVNEIIDLTPNQTLINICNGENVTYEVFTQGDVVGYEWKKSVTSGEWTTITNGGAYSGATTSALTIANATANESASYRVFVTFNTLNQPAGYPTCVESSDTRVRELVVDDESPVAICRNITVQLDAAGNATIVPADIDDGSSDNCGIASMTLSQTSFTCTDVGNNTVTLTVTDTNGNTSTCNAIVTVEDNVDPTANCQNITVQLDAAGNATIVPADVDNVSSDNCGIASMTLSQTSFTCTDVGNNTVTLTVTDTNGNTSTCNAIVTVEDNVDPTANCQNITVQLDAAGNATIVPADVDNVSSDNCGIASMTLSQTSFACADVGNNMVTLTVTDTNGNTSTCNATVNVEDNVAPTANCQNITLQLDATGNATIAEDAVNNGSSDNCGGTLTFDTNITSFNCSNVGANPVVLTVTDSNGNTATCNAIVTVEDTIPPTVATCPADVTVDNSPGFCYATETLVNPGTATAVDNCNPSPTITGTRSDGLNLTDNYPVGITTITWEATDGSNISTCEQTVEVIDNEGPTFTVPGDITIYADASCNENRDPAQTGNPINPKDNCTSTVKSNNRLFR